MASQGHRMEDQIDASHCRIPMRSKAMDSIFILDLLLVRKVFYDGWRFIVHCIIMAEKWTTGNQHVE